MPLTDPLAGPILEHWQWMKTHQPECKFLFPRTFYSGLTGILTFDVSRHLTGRQILRRVKALNEMAWCLPPHNIVSGEFKEIVHSNPRDFILGFTGLGEVTRLYKRHYSGRIVHVRGRGLIPFDITPEHPILISSQSYRRAAKPPYSYSELYFKNAEELQAYDFTSRRGDCLVLPRIEGHIQVKEVDVSCFIKRHSHGDMCGFKSKITAFPLNPDTCWLLGLFVAEGSTCITGQSPLTFYINSTDENWVYEKISKTMSAIGYKVNARIDKRDGVTLCVRPSSIVLARAFRSWCGGKQEEREIPEFVLYHEDAALLESFLQGYIVGDGTPFGTGQQMSTVSRKLALQLQLAFARLGNFARIQVINRHDRKLPQYYVTVAANKTHRVTRVGQRFILIPIRSIRSEDFSGEVWNLGTTDGTYLVSNVTVHNCHLFRETVGAEIVREDNSIMAAFKVMLRLDLEDERTALRYVRRYAIDRIRGVSQSEIEAIRKVIDETPLTEKQRGILLKVLEGL